MNERVKEARFSRDPEELFQVGVMFRDGTEVEQSFMEAKDWFRRAAFKDHVGAQFNLAIISAKRLTGSFSSDYDTKSWLDKAAKQDHAGAKNLLGMIENGEDLPEHEALFALDAGVTPAPEQPPVAKPEPMPVVKEDPAPPLPLSELTELLPELTEPLFDKDLPYANTCYQPEDLAEYATEPWDIRITLEHAPLDDAFYFTINDPQATSETIEHVLESFALDTRRKAELDTDEFPQMPHLQEELLGYYNSGKSGQAKLTIHVNKRPSREAVALSDPVAPYLSTCVFHDGSHDYRLLDLVFVIQSQPMKSAELEKHRRAHGPTFMLFLIDYLKRDSSDAPDGVLFSSTPFRAFQQAGDDSDSHPQVTQALRAAADAGWINHNEPPNNQIFITDEGHMRLESLKQEVEELTHTYERYQSVSATPPALGVPDGFDARIQIMRRESVDVVRAIFLFAFVYDENELFGNRKWAENFESGESFAAIYDAFQYETNSSEDVLEALTHL